MYSVPRNAQIFPDYGDEFEFDTYIGIRLESVISL
jgi:hypothetical protein